MHPPGKMAKMTYADDLATSAVAKICQDIGWHSAHRTALATMTDMLKDYIRKMSTVAVDFANHNGRSEPTAEDLAMTLKYMNVDISQLQDYVMNVDSTPLPQKVPLFPVPCKTNRAIDNCAPSDEERPECYEEWMPSLINNNNNLHNNPSSLLELDKLTEQNQASKDEIDKDQLNTQSTTNGQSSSENENQTTPALESDSHKNKLVVRVNLSTSVDDSTVENRANAEDEEANEANLSESALIAKSLKKSRAFQNFLNSALFKSPTDPQTKSVLRVADTQRLPNTYLSRENSPQPESQNVQSNDASNDAFNFSATSETKKPKRSKKKKKSISDNDNLTFSFFNEDASSSNKVKDFELKKERKSKSGDSSEKKSKKKLMAFSLKIPSIPDDNANRFDFAEPGPFDLNVEDNLPKTKKHYKQKEKPPKVKSEKKRGRPKKIHQSTSGTNPNELLFKDGGLALSPSLKTEKGAFESVFGVDDAAKLLLNMTGPNVTGDKKSRKRKFDSVGDDSMTDPNAKSSIKTTPKKVGRPLKQPKTSSNSTKKVVKSVEIIESSGGSSDDDTNVDSNPVSLLPPLPEPTLSFTDDSNLQSTRKRRESNSSLSSISSALFKSPTDSQTKSVLRIADTQRLPNTYQSRENSPQPESQNVQPNDASNDAFSFSTTSVTKKPKKSKKKKNSISDNDNLTFSFFNEDASASNKVKDFELKKERKSKSGDSSEKKSKKKLMAFSLKIPSIPDDNANRLDFAEPGLFGLNVEDNFPKTKKQHKQKEKSSKVVSEKKRDRPKKIHQSTSGTEKEHHGRRESSAEKKKESKSKKLKTDSASFRTSIDAEKLHKKEKKSKSKSLKDFEIITETIEDKSDDLTNEKWHCPVCNAGDNGIKMVGCDNCPDWFHYNCVGIFVDPPEDQIWYCPKCIKNQEQTRKKPKKSEAPSIKAKKPLLLDTVTITPIPPVNLSAQFPISSSISAQAAKPKVVSIPSTSGYTPTGRPRGRPRKDSYQKKPQVTITALPPPTYLPQQPPPHLPYSISTQPIPPAQLTQKSIKNRLSYSPVDPVNVGASTSSSDQRGSKPTSTKKRNKICPACSVTTKGSSSRVRCATCSQSYHWKCAGIYTPPNPDAHWYCVPCQSHHPSTSSGMAVPSSQYVVEEDEDEFAEVSNPKELCGICHIATSTTDDVVSQWVACDGCGQWYHFECQQITQAPPEDESWFCSKCIEKQKTIEGRIDKIKHGHNP